MKTLDSRPRRFVVPMPRYTLPHRFLLGCLALGLHAFVQVASAQCEQSLPSIPKRSLSERPVFLLDSDDGPTSFNGIVGVHRDARGRVLVADASQEIRVFGPTGAFLRSLSRKGQGPGELTNMSRMQVWGDTVFVIEEPPARSRVHRFVIDGGFLSWSDVSASNYGGGLTALTRARTGALLVKPGGFRPFDPPPVGVIRRDSTRLGVLAASGAVEWIGTFPEVTWVGYPLFNAPVKNTAMPHPLGDRLVFSGGREVIWIGDPSSGLLRAHGGRSPGAPLKVRGRREFGPRPLVQRYWAHVIAHADRFRQEGLGYFEAGDLLPKSPPVFSSLVADADKGVWLSCFSLDGVEASRIVHFLPQQGPVEYVVLPPGFRLRHVAAREMTVVRRRDDGVETVAVYTILAPADAR